MRIPLCLAMTPEEIADCAAFPENMAYMACHVPADGSHPVNCPASLPPEAMLILNDQTPIGAVDIPLFAAALAETAERLSCHRLLLDFERRDVPEAAALAAGISRAFSGSVGVSGHYAGALSGPVFLPPPPCHIALKDYLSPWSGREIWLEATYSPTVLVLSPEGCRVQSASPPEGSHIIHGDPALHCHYQIIPGAEVQFFLFRTMDDLRELAHEGEALGVTQMIGLYQELGGFQEAGTVSDEFSAGMQALSSL